MVCSDEVHILRETIYKCIIIVVICIDITGKMQSNVFINMMV